jgi:hypothetical protein
LNIPTSPNVRASAKTYNVFGKSGDGGGWHSWIDTVPNLGYGIVILSQESGLPDYDSISPSVIRDKIHAILAPAFTEALSERMAKRFAGTYSLAHDTGLVMDQVATATLNSSTYARLEVSNQTLYLRSLVVNDTSALEAVDRLSWTTEAQPRYFSTPQGVVLEPAEGADENAQFGRGAQMWRMNFPGLESCDWLDFDGYQDGYGWPLSKIVLIEGEEGVRLRYPPFDVVIGRG